MEQTIIAVGKTECVFRPVKQYFGMKVDVFVFNTIVLIGSSLALLGCCTGFYGGNWNAKDVTQASSSRAKPFVRLGPSDPEAKSLR